MRVLVCLPTYNEEVNVRNMVPDIRALGYEVVICDGHSTDATVEIARELDVTVISREGFGKGAALRTGMAYA